jgi:peptidoglycan/LPS O-acetylase OafA/YrhL
MRLMEKIGGSSYPIYLYHPLFVAAVLTVIVGRIAVPTIVLFVTAGLAGVLGPMLMERVAERVPGGRLLLAGQTLSGGVQSGGVRGIRGRAHADRMHRRSTRPARPWQVNRVDSGPG